MFLLDGWAHNIIYSYNDIVCAVYDLRIKRTFFKLDIMYLF